MNNFSALAILIVAFLATFRAHAFDRILSRDDGIMVECPRTRSTTYHTRMTVGLALGTFEAVDTEDRDLEAGTFSICQLLLSF